ncbi:MAG: hypothetical protein WD431_19335 [Cyclobacteriaceae bacterium]
MLNPNFSDSHSQPVAPRTQFFQASLLEFQTELGNQSAAVQKLERGYERVKTLLNSQSLAFADFDEEEVQYKQARSHQFS